MLPQGDKMQNLLYLTKKKRAALLRDLSDEEKEWIDLVSGPCLPVRLYFSDMADAHKHDHDHEEMVLKSLM